MRLTLGIDSSTQGVKAVAWDVAAQKVVFRPRSTMAETCRSTARRTGSCRTTTSWSGTPIRACGSKGIREAIARVFKAKVTTYMVNLVLALATCATVSLDGEWSLSYFPQPETPVRTVPLSCAYKTVKAKVPGKCEQDLVAAGVIPDPLYSTNGLALFPYERYQWLYAREFVAPACGPTERVILHLDGVDTLADVPQSRVARALVRQQRT